MTALLTGLLLGVAGSGHCAGMCGPLVLTIARGLARPSRAAQLQHALRYHAGRILTYVLMAVPAGLAGQALSTNGLGRGLALAGSLLLLMAALGSVRPRIFGRSGALWSGAMRDLCVRVQRHAAARPAGGAILTGAANGLLPCGLVYAAAAAAAATGSVADALTLMLGFGLGTTPVLITLSVSAASVPAALRVRLRQLTPIVLLLTAALLFARALGLPHDAAHDEPAPHAAHHSAR